MQLEILSSKRKLKYEISLIRQTTEAMLKNVFIYLFIFGKNAGRF